MSKHGSPFSSRFGYRAAAREITIREDAPDAVRAGVVALAYGLGLGPGTLREVICAVLLKRPDPNNWSPGNIEREVDQLVDNAPWYKIYDLAERLHVEVGKGDWEQVKSEAFERDLNQLLQENGVGWKMSLGVIVVRGSEVFELATRDAADTMRAAGAPTAAQEIHEALTDISRRPVADITGAIQHAMAALECVARTVGGSNETLGKLIKLLPLPPPLDGALHQLWGFASEQGRHLREGREPRFEEAQLVVTVAAAVSLYLLQHQDRTNTPVVDV
ncbi:MAG: hypothetical protein J7521_04515 [Caulobacter sp.]|nr:hypothetical protein [Caulobacter sp.]